MCHLAIVGHENCRPPRPPTSHSLSRRRRHTPQQVKTKASRRRWHCNQHHFIIYKQVARRRLRYTICLYRQHTKPPGFLLASLGWLTPCPALTVARLWAWNSISVWGHFKWGKLVFDSRHTYYETPLIEIEIIVWNSQVHNFIAYY